VHEVVGGRYELLDLVGKGSQGHVYRARDRWDGGTVAVKILTEETPPEAIRFWAELRHPNVVSILDIHLSPDRSFLVMEYVDGPTLREAFESGGESALLSLVSGACDALHTAHSRGVCHGDLKPANILVERGPAGSLRAKLADFGLRRAIGATPEGFSGTLAYAPPEVLRGEPPNRRSDLYSLGATLYEVVTGRRVFGSRDLRGLAEAHLNEEPPDPRLLNTSLSDRTAESILSLLAKEPRLRPGSAAEVASAFGDRAGPPRLGESVAVGRERHLRFMGKVEEMAESGQGSFVLVVGEHGAGKSWLLRELQLDWGMRGRKCLRLASDGADRSVQATERLMRQAQALAENSGTRFSDLDMSPRNAGTLARAFIDTAREVAGDEPFLALLDDAGRADELFVCFLRGLVPLVASHRLVIVATADHEGLRLLKDAVPGLVTLPQVRTLTLRPLSRSEMATLAASVLSRESVQAELAAAVGRASGGNPGLAVEVLRHLALEGYLTQSQGRWVVDHLPPREALETELTCVAESRIGQLDNDQRRLIGAMALLDALLPEEVLPEILGWERERLGAALRLLEERDLVCRQGDGWTLRHGLLSGAAKAGLSAHEAVELHAGAAAAIQARWPEDMAWAEPLARCIAGSGKREEAFTYSIDTAEALSREGRCGRALRLYEIAERCTVGSTGRDTLRVLRGQADCFMSLGQWRNAAERFRRLFGSSSVESLASEEIIALRLSAARALAFLGEEQTARDHLERVLATPGLAVRSRASALAVAAQAAAEGRRWVEAEPLARSCLECLGDNLECDVRSQAENTLGVALMMQGRLGEAREHIQASYELRRESRQVLDAGRCATNLGLLCRKLGRYDEGRRILTSALEHAEAAGGIASQARARNAEGLLELTAGFPTKATTSFELAARLAMSCGQWQTAGLALSNLGLARTYEGMLDEALRTLQDALSFGRRRGERHVARTAGLYLGNLYLTGGNFEEAEAWYQKSKASAEDDGDTLARGDSTLGLARISRERGVLEAADCLLTEALDALQEANDEGSLLDARCELVRLRLEQGRPAEALEAAEEAAGRLGEAGVTDEAKLMGLLGKARAAAGKQEEAAQAFRRSLDLLEGTESVEAIATAHLEVGRWLVEAGPAPGFRAAERHLTLAKEGFEKLGAPRRTQEAEDLLAKLGEEPSAGLAMPAGDTRKLGSLYRMMTLVNSAETSAGVLDQVLDLAVHAVGGERGLIILLDEGSGDLHVRARAEVDAATITDARRVSETVVRQVAGAGAPVFSADALHDARFSGYDSIKLHRIACFMCVPLALRGKVAGTIYVDSCNLGKRFTEDDVTYLVAFAHHAAIAMENLRVREELERENKYLQEQLRGTYAFKSVVGRSSCMEPVYKTMAMVARSPVSVVIQGETGTGKELIARAVHFASERTKGRFVPVNCSAMPEQLLESELFGYVKGAFTGAVKNTPGLFHVADGGTAFLDEIADMSPNLQAKLLRVLETGEVKQLGKPTADHVDVRIMCATNRDLEREMVEGHFREDLYYRLKGVTLNVPPLRERREDIPLLVTHFLQQYNRRLGKKVRSVAEEAMSWLVDREWPGNVRELEHAVEVAVALCEGRTVTLDTLLLAVGARPAVPPPEQRAGKATLAQMRAAADRRYVRGALEAAAWNVSEAARRLDIDRRQLQRLMRRYGLGHGSERTRRSG
jgi:transcriptional regulator with GAF, ATPase, and Fis domain/tetratricopeptide (TPR) repeat protein